MNDFCDACGQERPCDCDSALWREMFDNDHDYETTGD